VRSRSGLSALERSVHMLTHNPVVTDSAVKAERIAPEPARGGVHRTTTMTGSRAPSADFVHTFMEMAPTIRFMAYDREPLPVEFILPGRSTFPGNRASSMDCKRLSAKHSRTQPLLEHYPKSASSLTANPPSNQNPIKNQTQTEQDGAPNRLPWRSRAFEPIPASDFDSAVPSGR